MYEAVLRPLKVSGFGCQVSDLRFQKSELRRNTIKGFRNSGIEELKFGRTHSIPESLNSLFLIFPDT
jgi:hypothetical protein